MKAGILIIVLGWACAESGAQETVTGKDLFGWVQGIEGKNPEGRREFIRNELRAMGVAFATLPFTRTVKSAQGTRTISGENIVVMRGEGGRNIVLGAHLDAVPRSPGANDNGGSVAVILGLIRSTMDLGWRNEVEFCFFDQEEAGLIGSEEYARTYKDSSIHLAMINLDVTGMGNVVYVGPVGGGDDDVLMPLVRSVSEETGLPLQAHAEYPPSDHLSFAARGLENISLSVVPEGDVDLLVDAVRKGWQIDPERVPEVMKVMHTPNDKSDRVSPEALEMAFRFTRALLLRLNAFGE